MAFRYTFFTIGLLMFMMNSCTPDDEYDKQEIEIEIEDPEEIEDDLIAGRITDFDDLPIANATISLYDKSDLLKMTFTDATGYYEFSTVGLDDTQKILTIEKEGFLSARKLVKVGPGQVISSKLSALVCNFFWEDFEDPDLNLDIPMVTVSGRVFDLNGAPSINSRVSLVNADFLDPGGTLDFGVSVAIQEDGSWESIIPRDREMRIFVDGRIGCNKDFEVDVGPFSEDAVIEDITGLAVAYRQLVSFNYPTCDGQELSQGMIIHFFDGDIIPEPYAYSDGTLYDVFPEPMNEEINTCQLICDLSFKNRLLIYDYPTNQYFFETRSFGENLDFRDVEVCDQLETTFDILLDGEDLGLTDATYLNARKKYDSPQDIFTLWSLTAPEDGAANFNLHIVDKLEEGKTYSGEIDFKISYFRRDLAYGNFEGNVTITKIVDGYVFGEVDGLIYPSFQAWPHFDLTKDGPAQTITGTFKSLQVE